MTYLDDAELEALVALGLLKIMKSGATTLVDQFRPRQRAIFDLARQWGLRLYGCPYLFSPAAKVKDAKVAAAQGSLAGDPGLAAFERLFADYDEGPSGRIRVMLGPHAADSCAPDLLTAVDRIARERNLLVTMHLAQSQAEVERVAKDRGTTCTDYVASVGLMREGVNFAHGTHLTTPELAKVADCGAAIANCASVFLRGGKSPNFAHFKSHGVRVGLGTDAERMDFFALMVSHQIRFQAGDRRGRCRQRGRVSPRRHYHRRRHPASPRPRPDQARCRRRPDRRRCHARAPAAGPTPWSGMHPVPISIRSSIDGRVVVRG